MFKMTSSGYNALLKPYINGMANVLNNFNKDIAAGIFNFLLKFFYRSRFACINNVINPLSSYLTINPLPTNYFTARGIQIYDKLFVL